MRQSYSELGLLDSGANVSCIGSEIENHNFFPFNEFSTLKSFVKTVDGSVQNVRDSFWIY